MELPASVNVCPNDGYLFSPDSELKALREDLEFLEVIGSGANGVIYKVRHPLLDKVVAVKMLHSHLVSDQAVMRFHREAKSASNLSHPNIIIIHDFGVSKHGQPFMIMDYVEGQTLADFIDKNGPMPVAIGIPIFTQLCDALQHAHDKGVLHRDIKPNNMMLTDLDREIPTLKILDFGLAKVIHPDGKESKHLTRTGETVGSPLYMSPEQCQGIDLDRRSDIYSFGCVIYECLTGSPPHVGDTAVTTMFKHLNDAPPSLKEGSLGVDFGDQLEEIVATMLAKEPDDRFQQMRDVKQALLAFYQGSTRPSISTANRAKAKEIDASSVEPTEELKLVKKQKTFTLTSTQVGLIGLAIVVSFAVGITLPALFKKVPTAPESKPIKETFTDEIKLPANAPIDENRQSDDDVDRYVRKNPNTKKADLHGANLTDKGISHLQKLKDLESLNISLSKVTDQGLKNLSKLKLRQLFVGENDITDKGLSSLPASLEFLSLEKLPQVTDDGLTNLRHLKNLKILSLKNNPQLTDKGIMHLSDLKALTYLDLEGTRPTAAWYPKLARIKNLMTVNLANTQIASEGISAMSMMKNISILRLCNIKDLPDSCFDQLAKMQNLQILDLSRTNVTDDQCMKLAKLKRLWTLGLVDTMVSPVTIAKLKVAHPRPAIRVLTQIEEMEVLGGL